jgi:hypothetical protein
MKRSNLLGIVVLGTAFMSGCVQNSSNGSQGTGGSGGRSSASGGSSGTGGKDGSGGKGGSSATGGKSGTGGSSSTGGATSSGGMVSAGGGSGLGGATAKGGSGGSGLGGAGTGGGSGTGGNTGTGGGLGTGGGNGTGGGSGTGGGTGTGGGSGGLPELTVNGAKLQDATGKTIILRGSSLIDIGTLYVNGSKNAKGITDRIDKVIAAGVAGHVVRLPVYPRNNVNAGYPFYSELPYPVGTAAPNNKATSGNTVIDMTSDDYISKVLKPAVDYATTKNLYVIIDYHQIDDATTGQSAADATTFWTAVAPQFASYSNVLFEAFNEPIDTTATWATLKTVEQGWVDTIRAAAPQNVIIVSSNSWSQKPGDAASSPPTGGNLMFTAHIYPGNWNTAFQTQVSTAVTKAPVFITEWGYIWQGTDSGQKNLNSSDASWGASTQSQSGSFRSLVDGYGASWTAWVTDNGWTPNLFSDSDFTKLTDFGTGTKTWLADKATSDWVE